MGENKITTGKTGTGVRQLYLLRTACCRVFFVPFFSMPFTACQLMKEKYDLNNHENCILISSGKNWVEQAAVDQLRGVSRLPGITGGNHFRAS